MMQQQTSLQLRRLFGSMRLVKVIAITSAGLLSQFATLNLAANANELTNTNDAFTQSTSASDLGEILTPDCEVRTVYLTQSDCPVGFNPPDYLEKKVKLIPEEIESIPVNINLEEETPDSINLIEVEF